MFEQSISHSKINYNGLRENEDKFRKMVSASQDAIVMMDNNGKVSFWNKSAEKMFGYSKDEIIGKKLHEILIPNSLREQNRIGLEKLKTTGQDPAIGKTIELTDLNKSGEEIPIELSLSAYKFEGKWESISIVSDISEKKKNENELIQKESTFRNLCESAPVGVFRSTPDGKLLFANPFFLHMLGYTSLDQLSDKEIGNTLYVDSDERETFKQIIKEEGRIYDYEFRLLKKDGTEIIASGSAIANRDQNNDITNYEGIIHDVSESRRQVALIKKLSRAVEQSSVSIVITDSDGIIEYVNPKFESLTGYSLSELQGARPSILKSGEQSEEFYRNLWDTIKSGNVWTGEFHNKKKNGELFWEAETISPVKDEYGIVTNFVAVKEDITQKKAMIEELILTKQRAEKSDRMKSEFIEQVSHEIRTPLNVLSGFSGLIREDLEEVYNSKELIENLDTIDSANKRIVRTIDSILDYSEIKSGSYEADFEEMSLYDNLLRRVYSDYKTKAENKGLKLKLINNTQDSLISSDNYSIIQIFSHLVENAIKYSVKGEVIIQLDKVGNKLSVEIKDEGIGISEEYLPDLFSPYTQEQHGYSREYDGNGMGLALVKEYCELNKIDIKVKTQKNSGTVFTLIFNKS